MSDICLRAVDISTLVAAFNNAGLIDGDNGYWVDGNCPNSFYMIDDVGSGVRDGQTGAWACYYPCEDWPLPESLESLIHDDIGNCCGLAGE